MEIFFKNAPSPTIIKTTKTQNMMGNSNPWELIRVMKIAHGSRPKKFAQKKFRGEMEDRSAMNDIKPFGKVGKMNAKKKILPCLSANPFQRLVMCSGTNRLTKGLPYFRVSRNAIWLTATVAAWVIRVPIMKP